MIVKTKSKTKTKATPAARSKRLQPGPSAAKPLPAVNTANTQDGPPAPLISRRKPGRAHGHLVVERVIGETVEETDARMISSPAVHASFLIRALASRGLTSNQTDATMMYDVVAHKMAAVSAGDLTEVEGMLMAGALTLQAVSTEFIRRASLCLDNPDAVETYMRIGLKAAGHCRSNLEAIAEIKNPRPVFAKQTNIANGSQQVNNALGPQQVNNSPRTEEKQKPTSKLLEEI